MWLELLLIVVGLVFGKGFNSLWVVAADLFPHPVNIPILCHLPVLLGH
jgi:hypothetical protein